MKILYTEGTMNIGILDDVNYVVFDESKTHYSTDKKTGKKIANHKFSYFSDLKQAVMECCRLIANDRCGNLKSWLIEYDKCRERIVL